MLAGVFCFRLEDDKHANEFHFMCIVFCFVDNFIYSFVVRLS